MYVVTKGPRACKHTRKCLLNLHTAAYYSHLLGVSLCQHLSVPHHVSVSTVLWWCTNNVTAYSYIRVCLYMPFPVFIVMSVLPIMQVIAPHITVMLVVNHILNYLRLPLVRVLRYHTIFGSEYTMPCSLTSH